MDRIVWVVQYGEGCDSGGHYIVCLTAEGADRAVREIVRDHVMDWDGDEAARVAEALYDTEEGSLARLIAVYNQWHCCDELNIQLGKAEVRP